MLITGNSAQGEALRLIFEVQPCIQQVTVVVASIIIGNLSDHFFPFFSLSLVEAFLGDACVKVRISSLVTIFVADIQV